MFATRRLTAIVARTFASQSSFFHASRPAFVKAGDAIPNVDLVEDSPGNKVNLSKELTGKGVIVGVPAAFSKTFILAKSIDLAIAVESPTLRRENQN